MTVLALAPKHNTAGKKDASHVFIPEAQRFVALHGGELRLVNCRTTQATRREAVLTDLPRGLTHLAFFCHGWRTGIQMGFRIPDLHELAHELAFVAARDLTVTLYACSTAGTRKRGAPGGDGGFADELRDALCSEGMIDCTVYAHSTAGHATRNPYVRRFKGGGNPFGGIGGQYLVAPGSKHWPAWRELLRGEARLLFPTWSDLEILEALR